MRNRTLALGILGALSAAGLNASNQLDRVDFDSEIRPIFSDKCYACHGPDGSKRMANLRLDSRDGGAYADHGGYRPIVPGDSASSRLFQRIRAAKKATLMPPPYSGLALTPQQVETIRKWIDEGAPWEAHWSYIPPRRPETPNVSNPGWVRNPIDAFVLAKLDTEGLKPSPEAARATLIRRVSFDLTGLPPTLAEVDAFLADKSPDAYEKVVDRLLHSPRYGERMTMQWLDLARYADTHGYHIDSAREMWHWRDWVIAAFNRNMPFDEFTIEQLAGDLLPNPTVGQRIATGFNRNHMINFEGGAIPEEYQNEYVVDRLETTAATWMGTTLGCARCHDHKYDPIKQKEFYRFYAFFDNISEKGLDGQHGNARPYLPLPSPGQAQRLKTVDDAIGVLDEELGESNPEALQSDWERIRLATLAEPTRKGLAAHYEFDGGLSDVSGHYRYGRVVKGDLTYTAGVVNRAAAFDGDTQASLGDGALFDVRKPFSLALWIDPSGHEPLIVLEKLGGAKTRRGLQISVDDFLLTGIQRWSPRVFVRLSEAWPGNAIEVRSRARLDPEEWHHLTLNYDGSGKASGFQMLFDGKPDELEILSDSLRDMREVPAPLEIGDKTSGGAYRGKLDDLRIYTRPLTPAEAAALVTDEPIRATILIPAAKRTDAQAERLSDYYLSTEAPGPIPRLYLERKQFEEEYEALEKTIPTTMVMAELEMPRETAILGRGDYRNRGEIVQPGVPAIFPPLPKNAPLNRLTLARWLVSPANPLTARVVVNRYWQMYFGTGIVKTVEDFGSQGEAPSNRALLDWLATEFVKSGWDIRAMQRLIVTSAAYRQDSRATPELLEKDPENRLIARGPRFRLPAEMIRDNALAAAGLLHERVGGPSVFPYQPKGLWEDIAFGDGFSAQSFTQSHGDDLYRRSMYTFWKRTSSPPALVTFDAPDREKCTARRLPTNTPLQALVLLNDPTYVEAARVLAQRALLEGGKDPAHRIRYAFRLATARPPDAREVRILRGIEIKSLADYRKNPANARKLLAVGESTPAAGLDAPELAAWTTVASTILNLDETITKE